MWNRGNSDIALNLGTNQTDAAFTHSENVGNLTRMNRTSIVGATETSQLSAIHVSPSITDSRKDNWRAITLKRIIPHYLRRTVGGKIALGSVHQYLNSTSTFDGGGTICLEGVLCSTWNKEPLNAIPLPIRSSRNQKGLARVIARLRLRPMNHNPACSSQISQIHQNQISLYQCQFMPCQFEAELR
uniref:Uncharacterized protein n=1 Tax=Candidatus Kentrum sp. UNK TaxID=2126344 RepID=A0A451AN89_9GAMM|nr:MAG: hypothetical protein BECKUNK1418G_GA0071005_11458 [Candidatus Kentron sp. UNK]VFK72824.1 MAG: hypothetical protein BECKUNK1418H_GA0071006_11419 [Candidatus Kentron sp. UNK]